MQRQPFIVKDNSQGSESHEELSLRSVAYYNARTMGYMPPTPDDILDLDGEDADPPGPLPVVAESEVAEPEPAVSENGDATVLGDHPDQGQIVTQMEVVNPVPVIDPEEEDKLILDGIQNPDQNNRVYSLEDLLNHIKDKNLNLRLRRPSTSNGDCLFDSLEDLIEKFDINSVPRDKNLLRQAICSSFTSHPQFPTWMSLHFKRPVVFQMWYAKMKKTGTYSDNMGLIVAAAAHYLGII